MIRVSAIRFFLVVAPVPGYLRIALVAAIAFGGWLLWLNPGDVDSALASVLLLQMCAVSNGYASAASRGWFDPLLVAGRDRRAIAGANLAAAALPGIAAWVLLALLQAAFAQGAWPSALSPNRVAALTVVTAAAWAGGLRLPRTAAAMLWIALLAVLASSRTWLPDLASLESSPAGILQTGADALVCVVCPFLLLGDSRAVHDPAVLALVFCAALLCVVAGTRWVARRQWPLVLAA